jgi:hypothetical protein
VENGRLTTAATETEKAEFRRMNGFGNAPGLALEIFTLTANSLRLE